MNIVVEQRDGIIDHLFTGNFLDRDYDIVYCFFFLRGTKEGVREAPGFAQQIVHDSSNYHFWNSNLDDWIYANMSGKIHGKRSIHWETFFGVSVWLIWRNRNLRIFEGRYESFETLLAHCIGYAAVVERAVE
ncbi:hypothetical protein RIF29_25126 [Crotalaria pallida]|uniref:Uncharacterized protein n=1 Tax=Crotalaria pallida TaxID=3830 RepID=A0AAN9EL03_CROPI